MKRYRAWGVALVSVLACLCLVSVTRSWFVSLNETPPGSLTAGLVRFLPEGAQNHRELFTYGNLISGNSIDDEGVPHVLPGDILLPRTSISITGNITTQTLTTSVVHPYLAGESAGTVIHREERRFTPTDPAKPIRVILYQQRELMSVDIKNIWTHNGAPLATPPKPEDLVTYRAVTTSQTTTSTGTDPSGYPTTSTISTTETTYTNPKNDVYVHSNVRTVTVTHEPATYTENGSPATDFVWANGDKYPRLISTEDVLYSSGTVGGVTRSRLTLVETRPQKPGEGPTTGLAVLPLTLGNLSTVPTNVRLAISVNLISSGTTVPLAFRQETGSGAWCVGQNNAAGHFIELLRLKPAETAAYHWVPVAPASPTVPAWDLTLKKPAVGTAATVIPPVPTQTATPSPTGAALTAQTATPVLYKALSDLRISIVPSFNTTPEEFEKGFNDFYCTGSPTIQLKIVYLAKQAEYMDWSDFHTETLTLKF
ncbi:MAG: hypothetical protein RSC08_00550 [Oscillospiraceae bacterium]